MTQIGAAEWRSLVPQSPPPRAAAELLAASAWWPAPRWASPGPAGAGAADADSDHPVCVAGTAVGALRARATVPAVAASPASRRCRREVEAVLMRSLRVGCRRSWRRVRRRRRRGTRDLRIGAQRPRAAAAPSRPAPPGSARPRRRRARAATIAAGRHALLDPGHQRVEHVELVGRRAARQWFMPGTENRRAKSRGRRAVRGLNSLVPGGSCRCAENTGSLVPWKTISLPPRRAAAQVGGSGGVMNAMADSRCRRRRVRRSRRVAYPC